VFSIEPTLTSTLLSVRSLVPSIHRFLASFSSGEAGIFLLSVSVETKSWERPRTWFPHLSRMLILVLLNGPGFCTGFFLMMETGFASVMLLVILGATRGLLLRPMSSSFVFVRKSLLVSVIFDFTLGCSAAPSTRACPPGQGSPDRAPSSPRG